MDSNSHPKSIAVGGIMTANQSLLSEDERQALASLAASHRDIDGQRAAALLAIDAGQSHADAAAAHGLTEGQVSYILRKFRDQRLQAFPINQETAGSSEPDPEQTRALLNDLNARVAELQQLLEQKNSTAESSPYSPTRLLAMIRDNVHKLTPEMQLDVLRNFQGMSAEDLLDLETWKGLAYMMTYSARFQADQMRGKVADTINQVVPEPIQPSRLWQMGKSGIDRLTPEFAKQILSTFQGASREDLLDPNTWKGVWYMITYSLQFQAEQLKQRLSAADDSQPPN